MEAVKRGKGETRLQDVLSEQLLAGEGSLRLSSPTSLAVWVVAVYLVLFLIRPWEELMPALKAIRLERIYGLLMIVIVMLTGRGIGWSRQSVAVALFGAATAFSALRAWDPSLAWPALYQYATVLVTYYLLVAVCRERQDLAWLMMTYVATMYAYLAKSIWEYVVHDRHVHAQGVDRLVGIELTYGEPNAVAMSSVLSLPVWWYFWRCRSEIELPAGGMIRSALRLALVTYPLLVGVAVALTNSRGGMIGLAAFLLGAIWYAQRDRGPLRAIGLGLMLLLAIWIAAPSEQRARLATLWNPEAGPANASASAGGRIEGWMASLQMLADRPWTGVGIGNFLPYRVAYIDGIPLVAHNLPGQILGETGWIGGVAYAAMIGFIWLNARSIRRVDALGEASSRVDGELANCIQLTVLLGLLFGLSLHNGLRYNWLWIAAFAQVGHELCRRDLLESWSLETHP
jgi:O-antigen ligase